MRSPRLTRLRRITFPLFLMFVFGIAAAVGGCTAAGTLTPQAARYFQTFCTVDGIAQPIAVGAAIQARGVVGSAAAIDQVVIHPAVQAACVALGGQISVAETTPPAGAPAPTGGTVGGAPSPLTSAPAAPK